MRYHYAGPFKTLQTAENALVDMFVTREVNEGLKPQLKYDPWTKSNGTQVERWFITLEDGQ